MKQKPNKPKEFELSKAIIEEKIKKPNGEEQIRKYNKGKTLGKGGFAMCYEFICIDNKKVFAAKVITKKNLTTERQNQKLKTEIKIHKSLHHNQIVAFEHNFEDDDYQYMLLEICQNQTLNELLKRRKKLTELEVQCYIIQLVKGLQYLHSNRVIHRDLKLGNIFLNNKMELKIGDFGLANKLDYEGERRKTICGTPNYIAPEVIDNAKGHSYEVDIWAVGIIMYILLIGKPPFESKSVKQTYQNIKNIIYTFPEDVPISEGAKNLIKKILVRDPEKRPSLKQILQDDFFNIGAAIPKLLPTSTLAVPLPIDYMKRFMPKISDDGIVHDNVENNNVNDNGEIESNNVTKTNEPEIWVSKWVDYSSKYGLGYLLNNGFIGVYFNDFTKMILNPYLNRFSYIERQNELIYTFKMTEYPKELQKKVIIFEHFKKYIEMEQKEKEIEEKKKEIEENEGDAKEEIEKRKKEKEQKENDKRLKELEKEKVGKNMKDKDYIYVKKWVRTKQAIFFRLSNKTIQVFFQDHTEVILYKDTGIYRNKKGEDCKFNLDDALNSQNYELKKRVKYTRDILAHMIKVNKEKNNEGESNGVKL